MTQKDVADLVGVTMEAVTYWEKGTTPQIQYIPKIISFLGYDPFVRESDSLADKVWNYQRKYGVTLKQIAQEVGMDASYLGRVLRGEYRLSPYKFKVLQETISP